MITIRTAAPEELPQLRDLWRKCFGDPGASVDIFFQQFCSIDQVLVVDDDGEVDSMAAMLPGAIQLPDGTEVPVGYVYALATNPYMQGKGHARQLLRYADDFLQKRGDKAMVLVPASPPSIGSSRPWEWTSASPPARWRFSPPPSPGIPAAGL